jgi:acyl-coenzyme A thioesterase PaaI-like protein
VSETVASHPASVPHDEEIVFPASGFCFGCSPANPAGLHLRFFRAGDGICCDATLGATYQGATEIVHGGIQAVLLDEASCAAAFFTRGTYVVTGRLAIRYRRPCPTGALLHVRAHVVADEGRYFTVAAAMRVDGRDDVLTSSEGRFYRDARRNV